MDDSLSPALMVRMALGAVHGVAGEPEQEVWDRLTQMVARPASEKRSSPELDPPAQRELRDFESAPTSAVRAEALIDALTQRALDDRAFDKELTVWARDARRWSYANDLGTDSRRASLHGSVVQTGPGIPVNFVTYGPQGPAGSG
ncbi:hypothetical protein ACWD01_35685 [Streptomyces sp. NPDC002835]